MADNIATYASSTLNYLEELISDQKSGEAIFVSKSGSGKVYLSQGTVLWAFASGQTESFQSILLKETDISKEALLAGIQKSRDDNKKNLIDILSAIGISSEEEKKEITLRHTTAAIKEIASWKQCKRDFIQGLESSSNGSGFQLRAILPEDHKTLSGSESETSINSLDLPQLLDTLREHIPGFQAAMIIDNETGLPISSLNNDDSLQVEIVSAFYRDVVKSSHNALVALKKAASNNNPTQEILLTSKSEFVVLRILNKGLQSLYLLLEHDANPGMALIVVRKYLKPLENKLN